MPKRRNARSLPQLLEALDRATTAQGNFHPPLAGGYAYRFTIWAPVLDADGQCVFSADDVLDITDLLTRRFGGCTATGFEGVPPWRGTWIDEVGRSVADKHMQIVVYSRQTDEASRFVQDLKAAMETAGRQDLLVVERLTVDLLSPGRTY